MVQRPFCCTPFFCIKYPDCGVGNIAYLSNIGDSLRDAAHRGGYTLQIQELPVDEIERIISDASSLIVKASESGPVFELSEDSIQNLLGSEESLGEINWDELEFENPQGDDDVIEDLADDLNKEAVIQAVAKILIKSFQDGASDIHIEPSESDLRIRFRIDGVLRTFITLPPFAIQPITARLKVMSGLNIAERRILRTVGFREFFAGRPLTSVSAPCLVGLVKKPFCDCSIAMLKPRLSSSTPPTVFRSVVLNCQPAGILVVGPTGSGKSTTSILYK